MSSIYTSGNDQYFYSNKIKVFPCAYRNSTYDATARLNTEYNFTHLPHMVDKASYIIEFDNEKLICVINGYYFEIKLSEGDFTKLNYDEKTKKYKYLNICVASPNRDTYGENFIDGPHLCSWNDSDGVEAALDLLQATSSSSVYFFTGLKISSGKALSKDTYQCYALKLDDSAKLPIMANKIENSAGTGKPISQEFTTEILSATTIISTPDLRVASDKLTVHSGNITAKVPVTINNTLEVKTGNTSVLKAENDKVVINKPTYIKGSGSNLIVDGTGEFGGKLTVSKNGADITGATDLRGTVGITGKTTIGTGGTITEIENNQITTSKINIKKELGTGSLVINKKQDNIIEIKDKSNTPIFSVNTDSGVTYAKQINADNINATVEGTIDKAVNVTTSIAGTPITNIFGSTSNKIDRLKLRIIEPDTDATWDSGADQSVKIILKKDTDPVKTKAVSFFLAKGGTATVVKADEFIGVAEKAQAFDFPATIQLSGDVNGTAESTYGWNIQAEIGQGKVTNDKLAGSITNDKLVYNSITIGSTEVGLGGSVGDHESRRIAGTLYGTSLNLSGNMAVNNIGNIKVNKAGLKSSSLVKIDTNTNKVYLGTTNYYAIIDGSTSTNATFVINSARTSGDMLQINKFLNGEASSTKVFNIDCNGNVTANTYNAQSDRRLKENIIDYKPEKSILDLPVKKFDFIDGPKNQIGCIAQDLKEICPEIVNENEKGYLSIQESKLVYLLLDEVKKLKNEVEELKRK